MTGHTSRAVNEPIEPQPIKDDKDMTGSNVYIQSRYLEYTPGPAQQLTGNRAPPPSPLNFTHNHVSRFRPALDGMTSRLISNSDSDNCGINGITVAAPTFAASTYTLESSATPPYFFVSGRSSSASSASSATTTLETELSTPTDELADHMRFLGKKPGRLPYPDEITALDDYGSVLNFI